MRCATSTRRTSRRTTIGSRIEIGRGLGARWIVAGAFQRFGPQIRITARFVEVDTGAVLRNVKIDGSLDEIFALQDRIVFELTQDLQLTLEASAINQIRTPETRSVEAYELFSRGMMTLRLATRDAPDRAISTFERALAIDTDYAEAWAGLGTAYQIKGMFLGLPELLDKAHAAAPSARCRSTRSWPKATSSRWAAHCSRRDCYDEAVIALRMAIALDPKHARAHAYWRGCTGSAAAISRAGIRGAGTRDRDQPAVRLRPPQLAHLYTETAKPRQSRSGSAQRDGPSGAVHLGRGRVPGHRRAHAAGLCLLPAWQATPTQRRNTRRS